jgi:hypothetical protein
VIRAAKSSGSIAVVTSLVLLIMVASSLQINPLLANAQSTSHFAAVGDWSCHGGASDTAKNIVKHNARYILSLGDNIYKPETDPNCWYKIVNDFDGDAPPPTTDKRIKITIGNHDDTSSSLLNSFKEHFHLHKLYYSLDRGFVHLLVMNSEDPNRSNKDSDQYKFVLNDLEKANANPNIKWIIVEVHQPFFSSPNNCSASSCKGSKSFTETYQPLFQNTKPPATKVDLVLFGHVHDYQRTFPLKFNSADPLNPIKSTLSRCSYSNPGFPVFAIVGTGGVNFHTLKSKAEFVAVQQSARFGQLDITISGDGNKLTGQFFSNEDGTPGKCAQSTSILDRFTITKDPSSISTISVTGSDKKGQPNVALVQTLDPFT